MTPIPPLFSNVALTTCTLRSSFSLTATSSWEEATIKIHVVCHSLPYTDVLGDHTLPYTGMLRDAQVTPGGLLGLDVCMRESDCRVTHCEVLEVGPDGKSECAGRPRILCVPATKKSLLAYH